MQSSHYTIGRHGFIILDKVDLADFLFKLTLAKALEEVPASIAKYFWFDDYYTIEFCIDYFHIDKASKGFKRLEGS